MDIKAIRSRKMYTNTITGWFFVIMLLLGFSSCKYHTQHYMFQTQEGENYSKPDSASLYQFSEDNYVLQVNDWLEINVYTNNGEILIDPTDQLRSLIASGNRGNNVRMNDKEEKYLVLEDGTVRLPMIGLLKVDGRGILDVEKELQEKFSEYYVDPYVRIKPLNKRVILFSGKGGKVIPLENENMNLLEILALGSEISTGSNAQNVKIIRGDLKDPDVLQVDLSTIEGLTKYNLKIMPNDIIYVQAKRNRASEILKDVSPFLSFTATTILLALNISRL